MFCIYCGNQIPEGGSCNCRQVVPSTPEPAPQPVPQSIYTTPTYVAPTYAAPADTRDFVAPIKATFGKAGMLVVALMFTLAFVFRLVGAFCLDIILLIGMIACWKIYNTAKREDTSLTDRGFHTFHKISIFNFIWSIILTAFGGGFLVVVYIAGEFGPMVEAGLSFLFHRDFLFPGELSNAIGLVISVILLVLNLVCQAGMCKNFKVLRFAAKNRDPKRTINNFFNVMLILVGVIEIIIVTAWYVFILMGIMNSINGYSMHITFNTMSILPALIAPASFFLMGVAKVFGGLLIMKYSANAK